MTNLYLICEDVHELIGAVYLMPIYEYELFGSIHSMNKDIYEQIKTISQKPLRDYLRSRLTVHTRFCEI